jgi:hypothetical protein
MRQSTTNTHDGMGQNPMVLPTGRTDGRQLAIRALEDSSSIDTHSIAANTLMPEDAIFRLPLYSSLSSWF